MYLTHHYFVDLIGGSILAAAVFYYAQRNHLPQIQPGKFLRWDYEYIVRGHTSDTSLNSKGEFSRLPALDTDLELGADLDWAVGSSSSISSGTTTPVTEASSIGWPSDDPRPQDEEIDDVVRSLPPPRSKSPKSPVKLGSFNAKSSPSKGKKQAIA